MGTNQCNENTFTKDLAPAKNGFQFNGTLIERKSRVPQLQGVQGRSCSRLPPALGNAEDGVASAFQKGKQNEKIFLKR